MLILAVETSCDETSVALIEDGAVRVLETRTQTVHGAFGGVVPELAGRSHLEQIMSLTRKVLASRCLGDLHLIAATCGPGLIGSLLVGVQFARGIAFALNIRCRGIHHIEAHIWSPEIEFGELPLPFLSLVVSGGHTLLIHVRGIRDYTILGETHDDAMGEAYDKAGKLTGLGYPAGAVVDKIASSGSAKRFAMSAPLQDASLDFSFSGLKTALLYKFQSLSDQERENSIPDLLAAFQNAAVKSVINKVEMSLDRFPSRAITASGGAAANSQLRSRLSQISATRRIPLSMPAMKFTADNAGMIGYLAWKLELAGVQDDADFMVRPRWPIAQLVKRIHDTVAG